MSNQQVLEKAIQKAIDGGWALPEKYEAIDWWIDDIAGSYDQPLSLAFGIRDEQVFHLIPSAMFIFNHDFAKALWGDQRDWYDADAGVFLEEWKGRLQQMVIAPDPIKYLGENI